MADDVIKSFLVSLSYKVDKGSEKDFERSVQAATKNVMAFAAAAAAMAVAAVVAVERVARSFDDLYFASRRTGASVENIKALGFAFSQVGGSADSGRSAIENFAKALRTNPGTKTLLNDLGIATTKGGKVRDTVEMMLDLQKAFANRPHYINAQYGSILGLSDEDVRLIESGQIVGRMKEYQETARKIGLNHAEAARNGFEFERALSSLKMTLTVISEKFLTEFEPALTKFFNATREWVLEYYPAFEKAMSGIAERFDAVSKALSSEEGFLGRLSKASDAFMKIVEAIKALDQAFNLPNISKLWNSIGDFDHATSIGNINTGAGSVDAEGKGIFRRGLDSIKGAATSMWNRATGGDTSADGKSKPALPAGKGTGAGHVATQAERAAYIRQAAIARGIDPDVALRVAQSEGFNSYVGDKGTSFGDFQLHVKNNIPGLSNGGLGDLAIAKGIDIRDPSTWKAQTDFALDQAKKGGWGPWHGAARVGIGNRDGLNRPIPKTSDVVGSAGAYNLAKAIKQANPASLGIFGSPNRLMDFGALEPMTRNGDFSQTKVKMVHTTNVNVQGADDPNSTALAIGKNQDAVNARQLRNAQGAIR